MEKHPLCIKRTLRFSMKLLGVHFSYNNYLDTKGQPDPDLIIRTAGEKRLSNFLLWQSTYSELYFTDEMWPDFTPHSLKKAFDCYYSRSRKFGSNSIDKAEIFLLVIVF